MLVHFGRSIRVMPIKSIVIGSLLLGLTMGVRAMDLLQAYIAASQNDAVILAARAGVAAERERVAQAKAELLPSLNASVARNANRLSSASTNFLGEELSSFSAYPSGNMTLTLAQPVYRPQLMAQHRIAKAQVEDAEALMHQEEQNLAVRVGAAYFEALLAEQQLVLILEQRAVYVSRLDAAQKSFSWGAGTRTDIDEALARLDMSSAMEIEARQNVSFTLQQLQALVNQPIGRLAKVNLIEFELISKLSDSLEDWVARAELYSPQLQSLKARVEIARQESSKAVAGHYPTLDLVARWTKSERESVSSIDSRYTNQSVGLQLNIPIFSGGLASSAVRQTLAALEQSEQTREAGRRDLRIRVYKEYRGVTESLARIKALEQALRSADQLVLSTSKSFQAGIRTVLDILNAEQQRGQVMRDLANVRYLHLISRLRLLALIGGVDLEALTEINRALQE